MTNFPMFACYVMIAAASGATAAPKAPTGAPAAKAPADDADAWAGKVQKAYDGVKDFSASFGQVTLLGGKTPGPKASGRVFMQKPGKMRWEFDEPADEKKVIVTDGATLWMYDVPENQVIVNEHVKETTSMTALNFLEGLGSLKKSFAVAVVPARANATDPGAVFLKLTPNEDADVQMAEIVLSIDRKTALANEAFLVDALGNETRMTFTAAKVNKGLPAKTFQFEIPAKAEVIKPTLLQ